jgi:RHS repeat-associated protein
VADRGNRIVWDVDGALTTSTFNSTNQLQTSHSVHGVSTFTYDATGNQHIVETPGGVRTTSVWDFENRRVEVVLPTGDLVISRYREDGLRYTTTKLMEITQFIWDEDRYLLETDENGITNVVYTSLPMRFGRQISQYRKEDLVWLPAYHHEDALGSARALTDSSEVITDTYIYDAWGEKIARTGSTKNPFQWIGAVGYYVDAPSGMYYARARLYSAALGCWLSRDPLVYRGRRSIYSTRSPYGQAYIYANNNPLTYTDAGGLQCQDLSPERLFRNEFEIPEIIIEPLEPDLYAPPSLINVTLPSGPELMKIITSDCGSFKTWLTSLPDAAKALHPAVKRALECHVNIYCGNCPGRTLGTAYWVPTHRHCHICLDSRRLRGQALDDFKAMLIHEAVHIVQFLDRNLCACMDTHFRGKNPPIPPFPPHCETCKAMEEPAYSEQASYLYPPQTRGAKQFHDAFVKAGLCHSCEAVCPELKVDGHCPKFPKIPFPL